MGWTCRSHRLGKLGEALMVSNRLTSLGHVCLMLPHVRKSTDLKMGKMNLVGYLAVQLIVGTSIPQNGQWITRVLGCLNNEVCRTIVRAMSHALPGS